MAAAPIPENEKERLENLMEYQILDTMPEKDFDDITMLASYICNTPISLVSFIDENRQWIKSNHGIDVRETPREFAFCAHAINTPNEILMVNDATLDARFCDNPFVVNKPNIVFYAGVPLVTPQGFTLGTLCVLGNEPKALSTMQQDALKALSNQVMSQLEFRKTNSHLCVIYEELLHNYRELEQFTYTSAHDIKSLLDNIVKTPNLISDKSQIENSNDKIYLQQISKSSQQLFILIDSIFEYTKANQISTAKKEIIMVEELIDEVVSSISLTENNTIECNLAVKSINTSRVALKLILHNLIHIFIKQFSRNQKRLNITTAESELSYNFSVADYGLELSEENLVSFQDMFNAVKLNLHNDISIKLSIVKKLVKKLGGDIYLHSNKKDGTKFEFTIKK